MRVYCVTFKRQKHELLLIRLKVGRLKNHKQYCTYEIYTFSKREIEYARLKNKD